MKLFSKKITIPFIMLLATVSAVMALYSFVAPKKIEISRLSSKEYSLKKLKDYPEFSKVPVLLYHNIDGKGVFSVSSSTLREHFQFMKDNGITIISLETLLEHLKSGTPFENKCAVLSFDDGYKSLVEKLIPIAKEFNYPVTAFVYTDFISDKKSRLMGWDDLVDLQKNGIDIESHTISHSDLLKLDLEKNKNALFREIYLSKRIIELKMNKNITLIAYPYGKYNADILLLSRLSGYSAVMSTEFGQNIIYFNNYCILRHHIKSDYSIEKIRKIIFE